MIGLWQDLADVGFCYLVATANNVDAGGYVVGSDALALEGVVFCGSVAIVGLKVFDTVKSFDFVVVGEFLPPLSRGIGRYRTFRNIYINIAGNVLECRFYDAWWHCRQCIYFSQSVAVGECPVSDCCYGVGNGNRRQSGADGKCIIADCCYRVGDDYRC